MTGALITTVIGFPSLGTGVWGWDRYGFGAFVWTVFWVGGAIYLIYYLTQRNRTPTGAAPRPTPSRAPAARPSTRRLVQPPRPSGAGPQPGSPDPGPPMASLGRTRPIRRAVVCRRPPPVGCPPRRGPVPLAGTAATGRPAPPAAAQPWPRRSGRRHHGRLALLVGGGIKALDAAHVIDLGDLGQRPGLGLRRGHPGPRDPVSPACGAGPPGSWASSPSWP